MNTSVVSVVRYEKPELSVRKAVELSGGLKHLSARTRVFIKPNIVFWTKAAPLPKWGVITTSRIVEDMVILLREHGVADITIGEGMVTMNPKDTETPAHAFQSLGYDVLKKRYGVRYINVFERPFEKVDLGDGVGLNFNADILHSDLVVDLPVLKTHAQTVVSLGIKNLKGTIDIPSRKKCHSADPDRDLNFMVARLADKMPPVFTLIDGIYSNERGPVFDGRPRRSDLLIASTDILSADLVGATVLGHDPAQVPHLVHAAKNRGRTPDLSGIEVVGESVEAVTDPHPYSFPYNEQETLPLPMTKMGITGLDYKKYDLTMCTYCSLYNGAVLGAIAMAWKGEPWDDVEVLTGKSMQPAPGKKKTILMGKCMYQAHKDNPNIREAIAVKGCPPKPKQIIEAFHKAGIPIDPGIIENAEALPGMLMAKYKDRPEFEEAMFRIA
ncbi:DUF362 domain-containing protein [Desulfonema ishimotonii]|uniref:DUF362 domain-containing protein n=1 Tax=Desulfonema ishimotonii TaxID=45657 RepID=A0A401G401_9BACT|nr:DUF362 domain-containing protein [Desulfonema ishimotonii]GBC63946.1 DUF362 domain-containing protein [Desulfonema ishimotonii]